MYGRDGAEHHGGYGEVVEPFAGHGDVRSLSGRLGAGSAVPAADRGEGSGIPVAAELR